MEESRRFSQTNIISERSEQSTTGDTEQFDIVAIYIPEPLTATPAAPTTADAAPKTEPKLTTDAKPTTIRTHDGGEIQDDSAERG